MQQCSYSQVIQARDWLPPEIGTVAYFSFDNPGQSPRMPIYAGTLTDTGTVTVNLTNVNEAPAIAAQTFRDRKSVV